MTTTAQPHTATYGPLTIRTGFHHDGISLTVLAGPHYNSLLSRTFLHADVDAGRAWYAHLRDTALSGATVPQIEDQMAVLIAADLALTTA